MSDYPWCRNREAHEPHRHTIQDGGFSLTFGYCNGDADE